MTTTLPAVEPQQASPDEPAITSRELQHEPLEELDVRGFDPTQGREVGSDPYDDPTQGRRIASRAYDDPTQGRRIGSHPYDDPTQGRRIGSHPYDDPTRAG